MDEYERIINWLTRRTADEIEVAAAKAIERLHAELAEMNVERDRLKQYEIACVALTEAADTVDRLQRELAQLKERCDKLHYDKASLATDLNEWKRYVEDQDKVIVRLKKELSVCREERDAFSKASKSYLEILSRGYG